MLEIIKEEKNKNIVQKKWGCEIILHNRLDYCGKILKFHEGGMFSFHYHLEKTETWFVNKGTFILNYIDTTNAEKYTTQISEGDIIEIEKGTPHQLIALTDGEIFEVSTMHYEHDSYRIEKGDSQNE